MVQRHPKFCKCWITVLTKVVPLFTKPLVVAELPAGEEGHLMMMLLTCVSILDDLGH